MKDRLGQRYYVVKESALPTVMLKVAQAKEILQTHRGLTIHQVVASLGLSRSAFYKYRDSITPLHTGERERIITLVLLLRHQSGVLSQVLNRIAESKGNVLTISQGIPVSGIATASISVDLREMSGSVEQMLNIIWAVAGVEKVEIVAKE
jgi:chorismate mutase